MMPADFFMSSFSNWVIDVVPFHFNAQYVI